jgi:Holliday junction resolvase
MNAYSKGYKAELELVKLLKKKKEFHTVVRSAGSRSPFDVIAIGKSRILLCQVKTGKGTFPREQRKLKQLAVPPCARKEVWLYRKKRWIVFSVR